MAQGRKYNGKHTSALKVASGTLTRPSKICNRTYTRIIDIGKDSHNPGIASSSLSQQSGHSTRVLKIERDAGNTYKGDVHDPESESDEEDVRTFDHIILISQRPAPISRELDLKKERQWRETWRDENLGSNGGNYHACRGQRRGQHRPCLQTWTTSAYMDIKYGESPFDISELDYSVFN